MDIPSYSAVLTTPTPTGLVITREFAAPPAAVYRAWTEPALVRRWWAGRRGAVTSVDIELREGGAWRFVMDAGGSEVAFHGEYRTLVPGEVLAFSEVYEGMADAVCETQIRLTATPAGGTQATMTCEHRSTENRDGHLNSGMEAGMQESLDALEDVAAELGAEAGGPDC